MKIGIDIMGGDFAPIQTLKGTILAKKELDDQDKLVLFGPKNIISEKLIEHGENVADYQIVDCSQTIEMSEDPVKAFIAKTDSSITKGFYYLQNDLIDGFASAGSTGAMLVGATKVIGLIDGVLRPCISSHYPNDEGQDNLILDVGINSDSKPEQLVQFAQLGSLFAKHIMHIDNPKVALLNIGEEENKGNSVVKEAYQLLKNESSINFVGNVEGGDLYKNSRVNVIVCNGFTGNIVLKLAESFYNILADRNIKDPFFEGFNYENFGGTPILGTKKTIIVGHGKSSDIAIKNMILLTGKIIKSKLCEKTIKTFNYDKN
ncbi:MAG: phosphate--acyl-ACP acyltransferase [Bacteroidota bacterium]|nr:phosphate--acyl-ACP acyltransferase [Bacteroidota bacterium]NLP19282.1 phosphate acyltransferase [Bacteroidales bacterium]HOD89443.1 phosphate--acyl-ACP acyltransferase [Bacteroidales bacterium]